MKYKRMFCWVRPDEKKELEKAVNGQFSLEFARNFDDFKNKINKNDYLVMSMTKISIGWNKIYSLIENHHNLQFHLFDKKFGSYTVRELLFLNMRKNVINKKYLADELVYEFSINL